MAKNLKLNIKNTQIAQAVNLGGLKGKLASNKDEVEIPANETPPIEVKQKIAPPPAKEEAPSEGPRIRARTKSAFIAPLPSESSGKPTLPEIPDAEVQPRESLTKANLKDEGLVRQKTSEELRKEIFGDELKESPSATSPFKQEEAKLERSGNKDMEHPKKHKEESAVKHKEIEYAKRHVEPLLKPHQPAETTMPPLPAASKIVKDDEPTKLSEAEEDQTARPKAHAQPHTSSPRQAAQKSTPEFKKPESKTTEHRASDKPTQHRTSESHTSQKPRAKTEDSASEPTLWRQPKEGYRKTSALEETRRKPPESYEKLGPTGRHVKDLLPQRSPQRPHRDDQVKARSEEHLTEAPSEKQIEKRTNARDEEKARAPAKSVESLSAEGTKKDSKFSKTKEFRDVRPSRNKAEPQRTFDARDRQGLRYGEEDRKGWRKKKLKPQHQHHEDIAVRPTSLKVRIPIAIKDLASEMKVKASQLISKLFMQGVVATLNDFLDDETTIGLLGQEFGCEITIDTAEEERLRVTDKTIKEEISEAASDTLITRPPIVAFMGHVDHGKTSLIDYIRKSNRASGEAGAITQHIGAFKCHTSVGDIAILDTPGHEAFSSMRARGADVTDIVVLVVAGDEGIQQQTIEAIQHAKAANVTIVVALNKCDKPNFNAENVYRQLSEHDLLPESWGGQTITINCSAATGEGVQSLLEMLALQTEVLELKASPLNRARGTVLESEMHKGMGSVATVLVQNGTLRLGDALVFGQTFGRVKTMQNEFGQDLKEAGPSTPVEITGLSGLPAAGEEFIAVKNEKEAREIAEGRKQGIRQTSLLLKKKLTLENLFQQASDGTTKKVLNIVLRADVQGSLEALKAALLKITSTKAELNIIFTGVGEISESDVQLAAASKAIIVGFHTQVESHADSLVKELGIQVRLHDIIYHAIDDVKSILAGLLDKIAVETEKGKAEVKAIFKSSHYGTIAGCQVIEGTIHRSHHMRLRRGKDMLWKGTITSLKRVKEDVREVAKGLECGIVLNGCSIYQEGDILESYEISYIIQEL